MTDPRDADDFSTAAINEPPIDASQDEDLGEDDASTSPEPTTVTVSGSAIKDVKVTVTEGATP